jgi:hypothetical protein
MGKEREREKREEEEEKREKTTPSLSLHADLYFCYNHFAQVQFTLSFRDTYSHTVWKGEERKKDAKRLAFTSLSFPLSPQRFVLLSQLFHASTIHIIFVTTWQRFTINLYLYYNNRSTQISTLTPSLVPFPL